MLKLEKAESRSRKPNAFKRWSVCLIALIAIVAFQSVALAQHGYRLEPRETVAPHVQDGPTIDASGQPPLDGSARASRTEIDERIPHDPAVDKMLEPYAGKVRALET